MKKNLVFLLSFLVTMFITVFSVQSQAAKIRPSSPINVGVTCPYSGFVAVLGENLVKGIQLGIEVEGRGDDIKLFIEDTKLDGELASTKLDVLKQRSDCKILIGSVTGFEGDSQAEWLKKNQDVILMPGYSATQDMTMRNFTNSMVRAGWTADQVMFNFGQFVAKELKYKKIISIGADYSYPWGQAAGFCRGFMENGGEKIEYIWYPEGNLDFSSIMSRLQSMKNDYDAVFLNDGGATVIAFWKAWEQYGLSKIYPQLLGGTNVADTNVITEVSDQFVGVYSASHYVDGNPIPANTEFIKKYRDKFGTEPDAVSVQGYDTIRCIIHGLDSVGWKVDDINALIDAIVAQKVIDSPRGPFYFDEYHNAVQNVYIKKVEKDSTGKLVNNIYKSFENVSQFGPYQNVKKEYMSFPSDARDYPPTNKEDYLKDAAKYLGQPYVDNLIKNGGW
ncbi:MAG: ABC transporter substrate-binding protein [Fusobacteriaceae bacterium]|jgi:branched-chain amino acid transport system substrate-binding protein|nr:ABC transporter substrate-binding protein [Fusobacteriaceae bacterium]